MKTKTSVFQWPKRVLGACLGLFWRLFQGAKGGLLRWTNPVTKVCFKTAKANWISEIPWNTYVPPYNLSDLSHPKFWDKIWRHKSLQFIKSWPLSNSSNSLFFFPRLLPGRANKNKQGSTPTFILEFLIICGLCNNVEHSKWTSKLGQKTWKCCFD